MEPVIVKVGKHHHTCCQLFGDAIFYTHTWRGEEIVCNFAFSSFVFCFFCNFICSTKIKFVFVAIVTSFPKHNCIFLSLTITWRCLGHCCPPQVAFANCHVLSCVDVCSKTYYLGLYRHSQWQPLGCIILWNKLQVSLSILTSWCRLVLHRYGRFLRMASSLPCLSQWWFWRATQSALASSHGIQQPAMSSSVQVVALAALYFFTLPRACNHMTPHLKIGGRQNNLKEVGRITSDTS